jgi:2-hydroxycyclohexanecarboxyl-CoA dehydrogenase
MSDNSSALGDQCVLVTGGAGGIGAATAQLLAARGARVMLADRDARVEQVSAEIGGSAGWVLADVCDSSGAETVVAAALAHAGRLDVLVNCAGWDSPALFRDTTRALWEQIITVNYMSVLSVTHAALPHVRAANGNVVSVASDLARVGGWGEAVYAGAKAAVVAFSKSLAREVARDGVRVNCVSPAVTRTAFEARLRDDPIGARIVEGAIAATPMRRAAEPEEVAEAIAFLASDAARFITGQVLSVNGGVVM